MTHDIEIRINDGDYQGKVYKHTLALDKGAKMWSVTPLFKPCPSMIKERIEMTLVAREANIPLSGAVELRMVNQIMEELSSMAEQTNVTLTGLDYQERPILIDQDGFSMTTAVNETGRSPEYRITVVAWGLYE